ncbi:MAG: hypothetical protein IJ785_06920 [Bacteroidales bacterium]|nr:hypothetical protein [Bacteroidales bacterium]
MKSKLPMFRDRVPEWLRFPLLLVLPFVYQCSNPLYMNIASDIISDTALRSDDVMMCGFACILGITVTFPILFRLKFRFTTRQIIIISSASIILISLLAERLCMLPSLPIRLYLLVALCFLFGIFKVWGTFECMSSMMAVISPNMHLAPFLTVVFLAVFGGVELGGLGSTYISHFYTWHYVTYALVALHLVVIAFALLALKDFRFQPPVPLKGIDWTGMALWSLFLTALTALFVYGERQEWFHSPTMVICAAVSLIALGINIHRMNRIAQPFIAPQCFGINSRKSSAGSPHLWPIMVLFFVSGVMLSSQTVLQNTLTGAVLHYGAVSSVNLNWAILAGVVLGCLMGRWGLTGLGWNYKQLTGLSLLITTMYAAAMYFLVTPSTPLQALVVPCFFSGVGHALIFVVLTTYVESNTPFEHRFMMLTVLGLVRTGVASPIGAALYGHLLRAEMVKNMALLGSANPAASAPAVVEQALMVGLRNLFGLTVLIGVVTLLILLLSRFNSKQYITLPTMRKIYNTLTSRAPLSNGVGT